MSTYYYGSGLSYLQYLQAKSFVSDVTGAQQNVAKAINLSVARQTRGLIASQEALARENVRTMEAGFGKVAQATQEGFEYLSWEVQDVSRGISELNATFHWGFGEMLNQMTRLNSAVSELVKLAKTPTQTEANEYFQNGRDALRQGLYPEALEEAEKAIAKHKLEWRYYSLAGRMRLGSISGGLELVDLSKAEDFFLLAARYAKADNPEDAAKALLAASWAAYCQGKMGRALSHAEQAINLHPRLAEALFQAGKVYMALGEPENALPLLGKAIALDKGYALKAAADGDYQRHEPELRQFIEGLRQELMRQTGVDAALKKYEFWLSRSEEMRQDPLVKKARSFHSGLPLWDLLSAREEVLKLPSVLTERALNVRFIDRVEEPGPVYDFQERYVETAPPDAGFFRRLTFPKERVRTVKKQLQKESVVVRGATGETSTRIAFCPIPAASFQRWRPAGSFEVTLKQPFLLSATPVTVGQLCALVPITQGQPKMADPALPAVNLSWHDAVGYCNALSRAVGLEEAYII